jgi:hypothetical protein
VRKPAEYLRGRIEVLARAVQQYKLGNHGIHPRNVADALRAGESLKPRKRAGESEADFQLRRSRKK